VGRGPGRTRGAPAGPRRRGIRLVRPARPATINGDDRAARIDRGPRPMTNPTPGRRHARTTLLRLSLAAAVAIVAGPARAGDGGTGPSLGERLTPLIKAHKGTVAGAGKDPNTGQSFASRA